MPEKESPRRYFPRSGLVFLFGPLWIIGRFYPQSYSYSRPLRISSRSAPGNMSAFSPGRIGLASLFASVMMTATPAMAGGALDSAPLPWPLAPPFAGILLSIALGPLAADISCVFSTCRRRPCGADGSARQDINGDFARRGVHGRQHLHRQCA